MYMAFSSTQLKILQFILYMAEIIQEYVEAVVFLACAIWACTYHILRQWSFLLPLIELILAPFSVSDSQIFHNNALQFWLYFILVFYLRRYEESLKDHQSISCCAWCYCYFCRCSCCGIILTDISIFEKLSNFYMLFPNELTSIAHIGLKLILFL